MQKDQVLEALKRVGFMLKEREADDCLPDGYIVSYPLLADPGRGKPHNVWLEFKGDLPVVDVDKYSTAYWGGAAGRMGGGDQMVALVPVGAVFRTGYSGRLYGEPAAHYHVFTGSEIISATWEDRQLMSDVFLPQTAEEITTLVNLTPHEITIVGNDPDCVLMVIEPSGDLARCRIEQKDAGAILGVPVVQNGEVVLTGLPKPQSGTVFIASSLVCVHANRSDVVAPDTGPTCVRENGHIVAVRRFQRF